MKIRQAHALEVISPRDVVRFAQLVEAAASDEQCWEWAGYRDRKGYGQFKLAGRVHWAHRVSLVAIGRTEIPHGMQVHHDCGNTSCVNPAHLRLVTPSENRRLQAACTRS